MVARSWGTREELGLSADGYIFLGGGGNDGNVLELQSNDGCTTKGITKNTKICTLNW